MGWCHKGEGHRENFDILGRIIRTLISNSERESPFWFSRVFFQCAISNISSNMVDILNAFLVVPGMHMVTRTLENLENLKMSGDDKDDLDNLEISGDFFHSPTSIFYFHAIPIIVSICS